MICQVCLGMRSRDIRSDSKGRGLMEEVVGLLSGRRGRSRGGARRRFVRVGGL